MNAVVVITLIAATPWGQLPFKKSTQYPELEPDFFYSDYRSCSSRADAQQWVAPDGTVGEKYFSDCMELLGWKPTRKPEPTPRRPG